jgi:hypothetical protein
MYFGKKSFNLLNIERRPNVLLRSLDEYKPEQFKGSRHRGRFGRKVLVVWMDDAWTIERPDGISLCPDGCKGPNFSDLESRQNLLETKL